MFRKILLRELRSATSGSWPYFPKAECAQNAKRINLKPLCLFSYAECCSIRLQCQNGYQTFTNSKDISNQRIPRKMQYDKNELHNFRSDYESDIKTCGIIPYSLDYLKSTRNISSVWKPAVSQSLSRCTMLSSGITSNVRFMATGKDGFSSIRNRISSLHARKRAPKKKKQATEDSEESGETVEGFAPVARHKFLTFDPDFTLPEIQVHRPLHRDLQVVAYATADEYDLDDLLQGLTEQGLYTIAAINPGNTTLDNVANVTSSKAVKSSAKHALHSNPAQHHALHPSVSTSTQTSFSSSAAVPDAHDVLHMVATYRVGSENREIYFFREGSVVFWNVAELECSSVLLFLKKYETVGYKKDVVEEESEHLTYTYSDTASKTRLVRNRIVLNPEGATDLEKYTFSNAMAMSVKLGIWEASLDKYIDDIEYVSEDLSKRGRVSLSQDQVLQCMGQLCALRHLINLRSDLLDTPDFYWEHENLELLYQKTSNYLNVTKRTSVMNVKLSHCVELMELLKSHLNEQHASRLEWIIIILIMIEVGFEVLHVIERWL